MDVLADVLRVVRLTGAVFFTADLSSPWAVFSPPPERLKPMLAPEAECLALFHILSEGEACQVVAPDQPPLTMEPGDLLILPQADEHVMTVASGLEPVALSSLLPPASDGRLPRLVHGGGGTVSRFVCGFLHCDQRFNPLIGALPSMMCVRVRDGAAAVYSTFRGVAEMRRSPLPSQAAGWLATTLQYTSAEAMNSEVADRAMLARFAELLFAEVLRRYIETLPADDPGWLAGLRDVQVGRALKLLHAEPTRPWTVEELGREAGISRSALAERFAALIGESPIRYLASWRMQLAKQMLRETALGISAIAAQVGYESEPAFNRAFKRFVGEPPATWRDRRAPPPARSIDVALAAVAAVGPGRL
jgi:AraC family transcriptional regulator, alkane utilization regulator